MSLSGVLPLLDRRREFLFIGEQLAAGRRAWVTGPAGAGKACLLAGVIARFGAAAGQGKAPATRGSAPARSWLVLSPGREAAERLADDLAAFLPPGAPRIHLLTLWDAPLPGELPSLDAEASRQQILEAVRWGEPAIVIAAPPGFLAPLPDPRTVAAARVDVRAGLAVRLEDVTARLAAGGYARADLVRQPGEVAVRGGLLDVFPPTAEFPVRIEWIGDEVESVRTFDPESQRTIDPLEDASILPARLEAAAGHLLPRVLAGAWCVLDEPEETAGHAQTLAEQVAAAHRRAVDAEQIPGGTPPLVPWEQVHAALADHPTLSISALRRPVDGRGVELAFGPVESFAGQVEGFADQVRRWTASRAVVVASRQAQRVRELLAEHGVAAGLADGLAVPPAPGTVTVVAQALTQGFALPELVVVSDAEILGWRRRRSRPRWLHEGTHVESWTELAPGDLVVHVHHGIGVYRGLERLAISESERDYLHVDYAQGDVLYVPTDQITLVARYVGADGQAPQIHRLGGTEWEREKRRVRERTREMARELLELYAARERARGHAFAPDTPWQREMEEAFAYEETPDQHRAIEDVKRDMETTRPMDRLVTGDVGYGKTEVAVRAAFKAVMDGRQVAVLVPTTLLAQQHYAVFRERFAPFPVRVEMLSRFRSARESAAILDGLRTGAVDIVIGTHRLLAKSVRFHALGLVVIDEEQRFGVRHKERLKQLRTQVDVLTLTATPIPRTLHMSLAGLRDFSVMETPPEARQPIRTFIREDDAEIVQEAIRRELRREGQVYVVHNRVERIDRAAERIRRLVPEARIAVAHGQMPEQRLEQVMVDFLGGRYDVLVCTTIVEIGLDIPRVNTILIEDAHLLGLAQLYQLRGRVGRADRQGYAYLLYPREARLTPEAEQRLVAMREFVELGSGLRLAMRDMEIRGAGNLLGPEQHGHLAAVGFDLYMRLLEEAIRELRGEIVEELPEPTVDLGVEAYLPESYVAAAAQRVAAYRQLAEARTAEEGEAAVAELRDRYGPPPEPVRALADVIRLRILARTAGITTIARDRAGVVMKPANLREPALHILAALARSRGRARWTSEGIRLRTDGLDVPEVVRVTAEFLGWAAENVRAAGAEVPAPSTAPEGQRSTGASREAVRGGRP